MHSNLVASHVLLDEHLRTLNNAGAHDKECSSEILGREVIEEFPGIRLEKKRRCAGICSLSWMSKGEVNEYIVSSVRRDESTDCRKQDHRQS